MFASSEERCVLFSGAVITSAGEVTFVNALRKNKKHCEVCSSSARCNHFPSFAADEKVAAVRGSKRRTTCHDSDNRKT